MNAICTYCSGPKKKDSRMLPAVQRYVSHRIERLHELALEQGQLFLILSGEHGLLRPEEAIAWYDHLLLSGEVANLVPKVALGLEEAGVEELVYYTADADTIPAVSPYLGLITQACILANVTLNIELLPGDPA